MAATRKLYRLLAEDIGAALANDIRLAESMGTQSSLLDERSATSRIAKLGEEIAASLKADNPRFSKEKFYDAIAHHRNRYLGRT